MKIKIEITSVADATIAENPKSITFTVQFLHPCHYTIISDNGGLLKPLNRAEVNLLPTYTGYDDTYTMVSFPYAFPSHFITSPDCGPQTISINEPSSPPASTSGLVSSFISIAPRNPMLPQAVGYGFDGTELDPFTGAVIGRDCEATGSDCATVLADNNCPNILPTSCVDCSASECFDITVSSSDAVEGNIVSFPGISL